MLIGGPISKDFLNQLKSNPNIGKVIVIDLTEHGDKIYAGMSDSALMGAVPKTGVDFARGSISEKNGHFYYSDDGPEGKKRRNALAQRLFNEGLR